MKYPSLEGKRYISLARCSTDGQVDTSNPDQFNLMAAFADEHKMACVDKVALDGVSGSLPGARTDIDELIHRKRARNDFDVLLVQDTTRFTRGGIAHGSNLEYQLNAVGVEVVFVTDNIVEGDFGGLQKAVLYLSGKQHAKSISLATSRGSMSSLLADRSAHCRLPPYGIDRLYVASEGTPCHIIRNLPDGSQVKLDPTTKTVLARFGRSAERNSAALHQAEGRENRTGTWRARGRRRDQSHVPKVPSGRLGLSTPPPLPGPTTSSDGEGVYRVDGVDKESGMDTKWHTHASNAANAKVKGELQGIIVTQVTKT